MLAKVCGPDREVGGYVQLKVNLESVHRFDVSGAATRRAMVGNDVELYSAL